VTAPTYRLFLFTPEPRRIRPGRWFWSVGDGYLRALAEGVTVTRWGAYRARDRFAETCVRWESRIPALSWTPAQTEAILARYAADLHAADPITFDHMACAAECCTGRLADRMRALVDAERRVRQGVA
jgi:hypothetical protein